MGDLQPGVGYNLISSPQGDSLEILFPPQEEYGPEQFKVVMQGDKVQVAKGRVVGQLLAATPVTRTSEFAINGFAVYPTDKLTEGTDAASVWCSQGGTVEIQKFTPGATEEDLPTGSNSWGVYLIRNHGNTGEQGPIVMPFLAVMADGSEAELYSKPWHTTVEHGDIREYHTLREIQYVEITSYEEVFYGAIQVSLSAAIKRYNCQRIKIASINWYDSTGWFVTQHLIGSLYMPNNVHYAGELQYDPESEPPNAGWPLNSAENEDWSGAWTGYTKNFNTGGLTRTSEILV